MDGNCACGHDADPEDGGDGDDGGVRVAGPENAGEGAAAGAEDAA